MVHSRRGHEWLIRVSLFLAAGLLLLAQLLPAGVVGAEPQPAIWQAPIQPGIAPPHSPGTGFVPPPLDLSHITGQALPAGTRAVALPDVFDWRALGMVTPVRNQLYCGACYAFSFLGAFESRLLIGDAGTWDLAENQAKECTWEELNTTTGSCSGGNSYMVANLYSQKGSVLEACDPYVDSDVSCVAGCAYQQSVLDFRVISGEAVPNPEVLKQYIYQYGPIDTAIFADPLEGYDGTTTLNYAATGTVNHAVVIVGWSNNLPPVEGSSVPAEGWIVKNSWGPAWGDGGYFYITYGAGDIGSYASFVADWQPYDSGGEVWYYDEGIPGMAFGWGTTTWALAKYIPGSDTAVTRVEFWTTDATTDVDVYLYDSFDGSAPSSLLATKLNSAFGEAGYHSVALDSPLPVTAGNDMIAVVKLTNYVYAYPVALAVSAPIETGRTYASKAGLPGTWSDLSSYGDAALRLRTSTGTAPAPAPLITSITPNAAENTGTVHIGDLAGSNFQAGVTARLTMAGETDILASNLVASASQITCDFDLAGVTSGLWDVVVTNPDLQSATLANGFRVLLPGTVYLHVYLPLVVMH